MRRLLKWIVAAWCCRRSSRRPGCSPGSCSGRCTRSPRSSRWTNTSGSTRAGAPARTRALRQRYYYTAQGTSVPQGASAGAVRYDWFVNLELPLSRERFADPGAHAQVPLPRRSGAERRPIRISCRSASRAISMRASASTCSTSPAPPATRARSSSRATARRARSASTAARRCTPSPTCRAAASRPCCWRRCINTVSEPVEVRPVREEGAGRGLSARQARAARRRCAPRIKAMLGSGQNNPLRKLYPVHEGFGRTDALGRIGNTAFGDHLVGGQLPGRRRAGELPVPLEHLEVRLGAVQRLGVAAAGAQRRRGAGRRRHRAAAQRHARAAAGRRSVTAATVDIAGLHAHRTRTAAAASAALAGEDPRRHRPRQGRARRGAVRATLPGMPRPARRGAARAAGERAAEAVARPRVAHRSDSARAHRHGSDRGAGIHGAALRSVGHRAHERRPAATRCGRCSRARCCATCGSVCAKSCGCAPNGGAAPAASCPPRWRRIRIPTRGAECRSPTERIPRDRCGADRIATPLPAGAGRRLVGRTIRRTATLDCHLVNLLWDVRHGAAGIERTLAKLDVKKLERRHGAQPRSASSSRTASTRTTASTTPRSNASKDSARSTCRRKSPATSRGRSKASGRRRRSCTTARCRRCTRCCCRRRSATRSSSSAGASTIPCTWAT